MDIGAWVLLNFKTDKSEEWNDSSQISLCICFLDIKGVRWLGFEMKPYFCLVISFSSTLAFSQDSSIVNWGSSDVFIRGLTEENTQLGIISPIGYFKSPIGDILSDWGLVICSLTLRCQTHISPIPNWIYYPRLGIWDPQLGIIFPIGNIFC